MSFRAERPFLSFRAERPFLVILNEVKNLKTFTLCHQILRDTQDDNWELTNDHSRKKRKQN